MTLKWFQRTDAGDIAEMVQRVAVMHSPSNPGTEGLVTNAEEGSVGRSQIRVDDPGGTFSIVGHRRVFATETLAEEDDWGGCVWFGFSYTQTIEEGSPFDGIGRVWTVDLDDMNTAFERRILNDDANRPAEKDTERIAWLLTTSQAGLIDDDTMVSTDNPVDMDACDYRGQKLRDVFDDCAQQSGKNWYLLRLGASLGGGGDTIFSPWYGHGTLDTFVSGVTITNDEALIAADEDGLTFVPSAGTKLKRDPSRVFSGVWMDYDGGDVYVTRPATAEAFAIAGRDTTSSAMNVKTQAKAIARANRYLGSIKTQEHVIETSIVVPADKVNCVVHGHQVNVKVSWMPDYDVLTPGRVLDRTVRQIGTETYELALTIAIEPVVPTGELLIAIVALSGAGGVGEPDDLSDNPWTKAFWSGDIADAAQFPGPGGGAAWGIWYREPVPGESATVLAFDDIDPGNEAAWVFHVSGITPGGLIEVVDGLDSLAYSPGVASTVDSPSAEDESVFVGGFGLQKVNYGQVTLIDATDGTELVNANAGNETGGTCGVTLDALQPRMWIGWRAGTGVLTVGGTIECSGASPDYNLFGRGFGGILIPATAFAVVQSAFNDVSSVGELQVTLPSPP